MLFLKTLAPLATAGLFLFPLRRPTSSYRTRRFHGRCLLLRHDCADVRWAAENALAGNYSPSSAPLLSYPVVFWRNMCTTNGLYLVWRFRKNTSGMPACNVAAGSAGIREHYAGADLLAQSWKEIGGLGDVVSGPRRITRCL